MQICKQPHYCHFVFIAVFYSLHFRFGKHLIIHHRYVRFMLDGSLQSLLAYKHYFARVFEWPFTQKMKIFTFKGHLLSFNKIHGIIKVKSCHSVLDGFTVSWFVMVLT